MMFSFFVKQLFASILFHVLFPFLVLVRLNLLLFLFVLQFVPLLLHLGVVLRAVLHQSRLLCILEEIVQFIFKISKLFLSLANYYCHFFFTGWTDGLASNRYFFHLLLLFSFHEIVYLDMQFRFQSRQQFLLNLVVNMFF